MVAVLHIIRPFLLFLFLFLFLCISHIPLALAMSETDALLMLKKSFTNSTLLTSWAPGSQACGEKTKWEGVICFHGIITGLRLGHMGLSGKIDIDTLLSIPGLRTIALMDNEFDGPIPDFNQLGALKAIYLSKNRFSGEIPADFFSNMASLKKVWLSHNDFTGPIPTSLSKLPNLMELHLDNNRFSGEIPSIDRPSLKSFNVSNNALQGSIPASFAKMGSSAFGGNAGLCGAQVGKQCDGGGPLASNSNSDGYVSTGFVVLLVVFCLVLGAASAAKRRGRQFKDFNVLGQEIGEDGVVDVSMRSSHHWKQRSLSVSSSRRGTVAGGSDLIMINDEKGVFGLPDLMKAAAEVLGTGGLGSSYKAVMGNGLVVVVKRMREMNALGNDDFYEEMRLIGRLRHHNLLPPLAFHFRKEEKLLIYEYVSKGSLLYLLHGDRGPSHAELDWQIRLKIVRGITRGMAYLHTERRRHDLPHGNLKSANVLIGSDFEPLLTDYAFFPLVGPVKAAQSLLAFKSPESIQYNRVSPKSDVYCLGILILEILTGKYPCQYLNHGKGGTDIVQWALLAISKGREVELYDPEISGSESARAGMKRLLHLGVACVKSEPEQRPHMSEAAQSIEDIIAEQVSGKSRSSSNDIYTELSLSNSGDVFDT